MHNAGAHRPSGGYHSWETLIVKLSCSNVRELTNVSRLLDVISYSIPAGGPHGHGARDPQMRGGLKGPYNFVNAIL